MNIYVLNINEGKELFVKPETGLTSIFSSCSYVHWCHDFCLFMLQQWS